MRSRTTMGSELPLALALLISVPLFVPLAGCGAGVIAGAAMSKNGSKRPPPEVRPPELSMPEPSGPLSHPLDVVPFRTVVISDFLIEGNATLKVELRALGAVSEQLSPLLLSSASGA